MPADELTATQLRDRIAAGQISSVEATQAILDRIDRLNPAIGAYLAVFSERALQAARDVDRRIASGQRVGPLAGVPLAVKDVMCTSFGATTCGSRILQRFHSPYDATVVRRLIDADAVILGKTNMDEFAMGSSTENSGLQKTVNPWDTTRVPGGSSGGSAAAVAARMCFAALGSDTGGSIRQPASFCGVVGLKPTYGRVSRYGLVAYGSSLDQIGPVTQTVADAAMLLGVIAGHDPADSTSVNEDLAPVDDYLGTIEEPVQGLRIGIAPHFNAGADPAIQKAVNDAVDSYRDAGARIVEIDMPHLDYAIAAYYVIATAEASSNLARYDGVHYGHRTREPKDYIEVYTKSRAEGFGKEVKRRIMLGTYALSSGYYDAYYLKAQKVRTLIRQDFEKAFETCDALITPVAPTTAFRIGEKITNPLDMYLSDVFAVAVNLAGIPALSVPCGISNGLPVGMQIMGPHLSEEMLLRIGYMYQSQTDWHTKHPPCWND